MLKARIFTDSVSFTDISHFGVEDMEVELTPGWLYQPCDVAILYGLANPQRRSLQGLLRNAIYREHQGPIVVIESSLMGRGFKAGGPRWLNTLRGRPLRPKQVHPYLRVAVGGALGDDADFQAENSPADRWERQSREQGLTLAPYRREGSHILILGQVGRDASLRGLDIVAWLADTARTIRARSARPIVVRLHPSMRWRDREAVVAALADIADVDVSPVERPFALDIAGAWSCVTYSSGGAIDALLAGVPPICLSPANLAFRICSQSLDDLEHPRQPEREQFFRNLAYSQWTQEEIGDGTVWRHLQPAIQRELESSARARARQAGVRDGLPARERRSLEGRLNAATLVYQIFPKSWRALQARADALLRLGHLIEAKVTFEALRDLDPARPSGHRGIARVAEQLALWDEALSAWTAVHQLRPEQIGALAGIGRAALRLSRLDEAEAAYRKLADLIPTPLEGLAGLERVANERGCFAEVLTIQQRTLDQFRDAETARRHVVLLVRLDRLDDARGFVAGLSEEREPGVYLAAATELQLATHDWKGTIGLLDRHFDLVQPDYSLLRTYVTALRRLGRVDKALDLLGRTHAGTANQRTALTLECLFDARRYPEIDRLLQSAWESDQVELIGGSALLAAVVTGAQEAGGIAMARSALGRVKAAASGARAGQALRLNAIFQDARLDSFAALEAGSVSATAMPLEQVFLAGLEDEAAQPDLRKLAQRLANRRVARPELHVPDPSFVITDALEIALRIVEAHEARRPLSLVRLGDGEGALLPYAADLERFRAGDAAENGKSWWGAGRPATTETLSGELQAAIRGADIVGVPDLDRAARILCQSERTAYLANGRSLRGLLAAGNFADDNCPNAVWTSCHVHQSLAFWGLWDIVLPRLGDFDLITCHEQLGEVLSQRHGVRIGTTHLAPPERKYAAGFASNSEDPHFPDVFERLRDVLPFASRGRTVLVAAGMLGKIYCHWIRQAGGVAIDVGSAADYWCGYGTRGPADVAAYRSPTGTRQLVEAFIARHPRYALLAPPGDVAPLIKVRA